jgi:SpoVK/Ycf46/Vps4 family AAA+-type ATPase
MSFDKVEDLICSCCIVDEVESLAAARQAAISGSEPSDSIRVKFPSVFLLLYMISHVTFTLFSVQLQVVNALLTQMDKLKSWPNVIILTTSNITTAIGITLRHLALSSGPEINRLCLVGRYIHWTNYT